MEYTIILLWVLGAWISAHWLSDKGGRAIDTPTGIMSFFWPLTAIVVFSVCAVYAWRKA